MRNTEVVEGIEKKKDIKTQFTYAEVPSHAQDKNFICRAYHSGKRLESEAYPSKDYAKDDVCAKMLKEWDEYNQSS
ncbi:hypothetical protein EV182_004143 [Spiromyces aspiralis]|uniref:Uncharacterized protein n=1 Tax=Spiromyces aspiralis TaxID=68401 RepID=A0ACC1HEF2_9FUNG|nr:hypothetical protein EV182_004143 [Spiromyces aspiralis]